MVVAADLETNQFVNSPGPQRSLDVSIAATNLEGLSTFKFGPTYIAPRELSGCAVKANKRVIVRTFTLADYARVRSMLPKVSRCSKWFDEESIAYMTSLGTFFPFVICVVQREEKDANTPSDLAEREGGPPSIGGTTAMSKSTDDHQLEKIIGYAELHRLPHMGRGMDGRLEKVLVLEEWRGKKIAQVACQCLLDIARDELHCGRCDLTVEKPDAMAVYTKLGFEPVETQVLRLFF